MDSLILSQFVYIHFNEVLSGLMDMQAPVKIGDLLKAEHIPSCWIMCEIQKYGHKNNNTFISVNKEKGVL